MAKLSRRWRGNVAARLRKAAKPLKRIPRQLAQISYRGLSILYEFVLGLDIQRMESLDAIGLNANQSVEYEASKGFELKRALTAANLPRNSVSIDFGSGKGAALIQLARHDHIRHVFGVELSSRLVIIANKICASLVSAMSPY